MGEPGKAESAEDRFRGLFDSAPDPTLVVDARGKIAMSDTDAVGDAVATTDVDGKVTFLDRIGA